MNWPVIKRLAQSVFTVWAALTLGFLLIHQLPTGPWEILIARYGEDRIQEIDPRQIEEMSERLMGFDAQAPLYEQYIQFWQSILTLEFGTSVYYGRPVLDVLAPAIPWSVLLMSVTSFLNLAIGFAFGTLFAWREGSRIDVGGSLLSMVLGAIPYYVLAILMLAFLGFQTPYFPASGRYGDHVFIGFNIEFMLSVLHHVTLPAVSLIFTGFAALGLRAHAIRILGSDYLRGAELRGLPERRILLHYVFRNTFLPFYHGSIGIIMGIFGGAVITEFIFNYLGMGWYLFRFAVAGDIPGVLAAFAFFTIAGVIMLLIVDFTYHLIDPRAEGVGTSESY